MSTPEPSEPTDQINIKFKNREQTLVFEEAIAEVQLGDSEWQRIGEAIDKSDMTLEKAIEENSEQIKACVCLHTSYIKKLGGVACVLGFIAVVLGVVAVQISKQ